MKQIDILCDPDRVIAALQLFMQRRQYTQARGLFYQLFLAWKCIDFDDEARWALYWDLFLSCDPKNKELRRIVRFIPQLQDRAWAYLTTTPRVVYLEDLEYVIAHVPRYAEEARVLLDMQHRVSKLIANSNIDFLQEMPERPRSQEEAERRAKKEEKLKKATALDGPKVKLSALDLWERRKEVLWQLLAQLNYPDYDMYLCVKLADAAMFKLAFALSTGDVPAFEQSKMRWIFKTLFRNLQRSLQRRLLKNK